MSSCSNILETCDGWVSKSPKVYRLMTCTAFQVEMHSFFSRSSCHDTSSVKPSPNSRVVSPSSSFPALLSLVTVITFYSVLGLLGHVTGSSVIQSSSWETSLELSCKSVEQRTVGFPYSFTVSTVVHPGGKMVTERGGLSNLFWKMGINQRNIQISTLLQTLISGESMG